MVYVHLITDNSQDGGHHMAWNRYHMKEDLENGSYGLVKLVHNQDDDHLYVSFISY